MDSLEKKSFNTSGAAYGRVAGSARLGETPLNLRISRSSLVQKLNAIESQMGDTPSIMGSLTTQALDMFFGDEAIQSRIVKPLKRRAVPFVVGSLLVNLLLIGLLVYLVLRVECLSRFLQGVRDGTAPQ